MNQGTKFLQFKSTQLDFKERNFISEEFQAQEEISRFKKYFNISKNTNEIFGGKNS